MNRYYYVFTMDKKSLKQLAVAYKGGCCLLCGYDKNPGSLDFHHINSFEKCFNISDYSYWDEIMQAELNKCVLLCKNCHMETHSGKVDHEIFTILES